MPEFRTRTAACVASVISLAAVTLTTSPAMAAAKPALGRRTLHQGMRGTDVRLLQSDLTKAGIRTSTDGDFGPATARSVKTFERRHHLRANGLVNGAVVRALEAAIAGRAKSTAPALASAPASTSAGGTAVINPDGTATAPAGAPAAVKEVIAAANQIIHTPYVYGGGHGSFDASGYDCSGAVSYALHGAALLSSPEDSTGLESFGSSGHGNWITVYADSGHAFMVVAGIAFDTAHYGPTTPTGSGPRWLNAANATANLSDGGDYVVRHPAGL